MKKTIGISTLASIIILFETMTTKAQHHMDTLTSRQQNMMVLAAFEAKGDTFRLKTAVANALDYGLTMNETKEIFSHLYAYTGFPRSLNGLGILQTVLAQRKAKGINDPEGREASPLPDGYEALKLGRAIQTKLNGGKPFDYNFAPATDYYLKAHLFGDIFARDILTHAERELITISALSSMEGVESQLKSHIRGAVNMGISEKEIHAIPEILSQKVGEQEAWQADKAIAEVYELPFSKNRPVGNTAFPLGKPNTAYAQYFIGNSYLAPLLSGNLPMSNVTFEPRCRNNWHIHHKSGQILICINGAGWYQEWGKPARALHPGDVVNIPPGIKHWHGATATSWFQHIAITLPADSASNEWLEAVTDEVYDQLE